MWSFDIDVTRFRASFRRTVFRFLQQTDWLGWLRDGANEIVIIYARTLGRIPKVVLPSACPVFSGRCQPMVLSPHHLGGCSRCSQLYTWCKSVTVFMMSTNCVLNNGQVPSLFSCLLNCVLYWPYKAVFCNSPTWGLSSVIFLLLCRYIFRFWDVKQKIA